MNISSAFILANKTKEIPIPTPGEQVNPSITLNGNISYYDYMFKNENEDRGVVYPAGGAYITETRGWAMQNVHNGEYYSDQGYDCVPCNCGGNNANVVTTLKPENGGSVLWNGRHYVYYYMNYFTPTGSVTLDVSSLPVGDYVFEVTHWIGYDDKTSETSIVRVDGNRGRVIKLGTHGIIEGVVFPDPIRYEGLDSTNHDYRGYVVKARLRYAFTVSSGDTTKTFEFGTGKEISFTDLWDCVFMQELTSGQPTHSVWANCHTSFNIKVYKGG